MDPTAPLIPSPPTIRTSWKQKKFLIPAALVSIIFITAITVILTTQKSSEVAQVPQIQTIPSKELAEKTLSFTEKAKQLNGGNYPATINCSTVDNNCTSQSELKSGDAFIIFANVQMYLANGSRNNLVHAENLLNEGVSKCVKKVEPGCYRYLLPLSTLYTTAKDQKYLALTNQLKPSLDAEILRADTNKLIPADKLVIAGYAAKFFAVTGDESYKTKAENYYDNNKDDRGSTLLYTTKEGADVRMTDCMLLLSTTDLYRNLKDQKYLSDAVAIYQRAKIHNNMREFSSLLQHLFCLESYISLYELTGDKIYLDQLLIMLQSTNSFFLDKTEFVFTSSIPGELKKKDLLGNGWLASIFARMGNNNIEI